MRERSKMKLWREYFMVHGRNMTLLRYPPFQRLLQVGLPSRLRGELWEVMSGSICGLESAANMLTLRPPLCQPANVQALVVGERGQELTVDRRD
jgi:hypothetical protein